MKDRTTFIDITVIVVIVIAKTLATGATVIWVVLIVNFKDLVLKKHYLLSTSLSCLTQLLLVLCDMRGLWRELYWLDGVFLITLL